jgi:hypothetical protein
MDTEIPELSPDKARFHVLPVPYEKTVSYGHGTALGPGLDHCRLGPARALGRRKRPGRRRDLYVARRSIAPASLMK